MSQRVVLIGLIAAFIGSGSIARAAATCSVEQGQLLIDQGRYKQAIQEFTCVIEAQPTEVEGYRGRIEAQLLIGAYSDAMADYSLVTAFVLPAHPDGATIILTGYADRLAIDPHNIPALTGASFARWWLFQYAQAIQLLNDLLAVRPDDPYGNLFRGSSRLLRGATPQQGVADIEYAIALAPKSADVRWVVADAYTYGMPHPERAFFEATLALNWGLDTPRVHAILASAHLAFGNQALAATHIDRHIRLVTTELVPTAPLAPRSAASFDLVPGRTYEIPVPAVAGETISIGTSSNEIWDTILVLLAPDGTPVVGSDDDRQYYAGLDWAVQVTGTYSMRVTSFEAINTGVLNVKRN